MAHAGDPDRSHVTMRAVSQYRIVYGMVISVDFPKRNRTWSGFCVLAELVVVMEALHGQFRRF